jgi:septum formation protein
VSAPPAPPLLLASRSPQRRGILEQLGIPFEVVLPQFDEVGADAADPEATVRENARGKARSVAGVADGRPVLGVDTDVVVEGRVFGKPGNASEAEAMLEALAGRTHEVVSGHCLLTSGWEEVEQEVTRVSFRALDARDLAAYIGTGEWEGRAGAYAVQGRGAALVERIEGDYLNVVGLPAAPLIRPRVERFPGVYGIG